MDENLNIKQDWFGFLKQEFEKEYFHKLEQKINKAYSKQIIYPPKKLIFNAFNLCHLNNLKVIIIGQDPYHGPNQANGLSFSVNPGIKIPPSLKNIFKELVADIPGFKIPSHGNLSNWAKQGVLLLNTILTVEATKPGSHQNWGWENFTDEVIQKISTQKNNLVFILWGNFAASKSYLINEDNHLILKAAHPSPLARGAFFGCKHFSKTNAYLLSHNQAAIDWQIENPAELNLKF